MGGHSSWFTGGMSAPVPAVERLRGLARWPVVVAPMAGGPSTVALVVAATEAGALGFLAGGYKSASAMAAEMAAVRAAGVAAFGVNVFVPGEPTADSAGLEAYLESLGKDASALGVELGAPTWDDDDYPAKVRALLDDPPALVSFTFGCPTAEVVRSLQAAGSMVCVTVTTPEEASSALALGADCLCLQGSEAGAHRGHFANDDRPDQDRPRQALLAAVARRTRVPLIVAGGIGGPDEVARSLTAGAAMVQLGTAFLRCPESGAHPVHKVALAHPLFQQTAVTRAYSGRRARGLVNRFMELHDRAPAAYPEINNATRPLRAAAAAAGDPHRMSLYAGTASGLARAVPVAEVVEDLVSGLRA
jgi:nitronate monooxygenase